MKLLFFKLTTRNAPLGRGHYYALNVVAWCYAIVWIVCLFLMWYYWEVVLWIKVALNLVLIMLTPALSDLAKSYGKYKAEWEQEHGTRIG